MVTTYRCGCSLGLPEYGEAKEVPLERFNIEDVPETPASVVDDEGSKDERPRAGIEIEGNSQIRLEAILEHEIARGQQDAF